MLPLAALMAALLAVVVDGSRAPLPAAALLVAAAAALALPAAFAAAASAISARLGRPGPAWARRLLALTGVALAAPSGAIALRRLARIAPDPAVWALPGAIVALLVVVAIPIVAVWRGKLDARGPRAVAISATACVASAGLVGLHLGEGTLANMRPSSGPLHVALFVGTLLATLPLSFVVGAAAESPPIRSARAWRRWVVAFFAAALGVAFLAADRFVLVDSYPYVHAWLVVSGLASVAAGLALAAPERLDRLRRRARIAGSTALVAAAAIAVVAGRSAGPVTRAALDEAPIGKVALDMLLPVPSRGPVPAETPLLDVDQRLSSPGPRGRPNILLITVDALRADRLDGAFPALRALAARSVRFERAYAPASRTALSLGALHFGVYPAHIDWRLLLYRGGGKLDDPATMSEAEIEALRGKFVFTTVPGAGGRMLPERLKARGYRTMATAYAGRNEFFRAEGPYDRGWDDFVDLADKDWDAPTSARIARTATRQVARADQKRWFQWLHFYDPHEAGSSVRRYDRMVRAFDHALGDLLADYEKRGALDNTLIVLSADHGEAFGEHHHHTHGSSLYEEQVRIPLLFAMPDLPPRTITEPVSLVDVTASIVVAAGADVEGLDGVNLWPTILEEQPLPRRPVFLQLHRYLSNEGGRTTDLVAVLLDGHKLIVDRRRGTARLFALADDPGETRSILAHAPARGAMLQGLLDAFLARAEAEHPLP